MTIFTRRVALCENGRLIRALVGIKRKKMKNNIAVFLLITFVCTHALAQGMSPTIEAILKQTMAADGQLTKQMHHNFWKEINSLGSSKEISQLKKTLEVNILYAQEY